MEKVYDCSCRDWVENIGLLNAGFVLSHARGYGGYTGKPIKYCPWCGTLLPAVKESCEHKWISADKEVSSGGEICLICKRFRARV